MQAKLGIKGCTAFDVQAVCSGFVYALAIADKFIRSGQNRCALVVGTEVYSRILDWNDRGTAVLFGDGAGAVVLKAGSRPGILGSVLHADGSYADILSVPGNVCGGKIVCISLSRSSLYCAMPTAAAKRTWRLRGKPEKFGSSIAPRISRTRSARKLKHSTPSPSRMPR